MSGDGSAAIGHPGQRAGPGQSQHGGRRADRSRPAARSSWSRSSPPATGRPRRSPSSASACSSRRCATRCWPSEIDFAVHSYKDLPTARPTGLYIAAVPPREDPRDVLVARDGLTPGRAAAGAVIGTGALRRIAQLHALGPSRCRSCRSAGTWTAGCPGPRPDADLDAVVLARAGLARLGRAARSPRSLDPMLMLPAPAQGALAVECRADDADLVELLAALDHAPYPRRGHRGAGAAGRRSRRGAPPRSPHSPRSPRATTATRSTCAAR